MALSSALHNDAFHVNAGGPSSGEGISAAASATPVEVLSLVRTSVWSFSRPPVPRTPDRRRKTIELLVAAATMLCAAVLAGATAWTVLP